jgi:hypothetical protein
VQDAHQRAVRVLDGVAGDIQAELDLFSHPVTVLVHQMDLHPAALLGLVELLPAAMADHVRSMKFSHSR